MVIYNECVVYNSVLMHFDMEKLNPLNIPFTSTCSGKEHVSLGHANNRPNRVREVVNFSELFQFWCECCLMVEVEEVSHWNDITTLKGLIF